MFFTNLSENHASSAGGAIYNHAAAGSSLTVIGQSDVSYNDAPLGGAVANSKSVAPTFVLTCTFSGNMSITGPNGPVSAGDAIYNFSSALTVDNSAFSLNNQGTGVGGAVYNDGTSAEPGNLVVRNGSTFANNPGIGIINGTSMAGGSAIASVIDSTFQGNGSGTTGGAILDQGGGQLSVFGSTFTKNVTSIENMAPAVLSVTNSTFTADGFSGPTFINSSQAAQVEYSTFSGDTILNFSGGILKLAATIVAAPGGCQGNKPIDGGYNLDGGTSCGFNSANHSLINTDPKLGPLQNNGGPTETMGLPTGSPAIDQLPPGAIGCGTSITADQRGVPRPQPTPTSKCDIGAVEHLFSNTPISGAACDGVYNQTFDGSVTVYPGQSCVFLGGGITGNVDVKGGHLGLSSSTVGGDVKIEGTTSFSIGLSATIGGRLEIHHLFPSQAPHQVCGSTIGGSLELHNNEAPIQIGSQDLSSCPGNAIGGDVEVHENGSSTGINYNTVQGEIRDHNNAGPSQVFGDIITGKLQCEHNLSITGGLDSAKRKEGQCSSF